ncbi:glycosyltransferase family 2 protein [Helicobacter sp. 23-1044]
MKNATDSAIVSIIIPIYNVAPYLRECVDSALNQSYANLDIILVDDGSSDESLQIALDSAKKDERIFVVSKPNGGLSSARNFGLEFIKGSALREFFKSQNISDKIPSFTQTHTKNAPTKEISPSEINAHFTQISPNFIKSDLVQINSFITQKLPDSAIIHFLDSDDFLAHDCIEICMQNLIAKNLEIFAHNWSDLSECGERKNGWYLSDIKKQNYESGLEMLVANKYYAFFFAWQGAFRARILNRYALRFSENIYHEDHDFGTLLFCLAHKVAYQNAPLYIYRQRAESIMNTQNANGGGGFAYKTA